MSHKLEVILLGTGGSIPAIGRNPSATIVQNEGKCYLVDCGEGTQYNLMKSTIKMNKLSHIFLTHSHGDHCNGILGLMETMKMYSRTDPLAIIGNMHTINKIKVLLSASTTSFPFINFIILDQSNNRTIDIDDMKITVFNQRHSVPSFAYLFEKKAAIGTFDIQKAKDMNLPPGPIYSKLKNGEQVFFDGNILNGKEFVGKSKDPIKIYFSGDCLYSEKNIEDIKNCDMIIHEASFSDKYQKHANLKKHSTSTDAARFALKAHCRTLIMNHFVVRSDKKKISPSRYVQQLQKEAREIFPNSYTSNDYDHWVISNETISKIK